MFFLLPSFLYTENTLLTDSVRSKSSLKRTNDLTLFSYRLPKFAPPPNPVFTLFRKIIKKVSVSSQFCLEALQ